MNRYYQSIQPISLQLAKAFEESQRYISRIIYPYAEIAKQMEQLRSALTIPQSTLEQIQKLYVIIEERLPIFAYNFQIASTYFESLNSISLSVPDYLSSYQKISGLIFNATSQLSTAYSNIKNVVVEYNVSPEVIPNYIVKPTLEISGHFKLLKDLKYSIDEDSQVLEEDYTKIIEEDCRNTDNLVLQADQSWMILLQGAEQSLKSTNPDKVRHTITSLRELITQVIHRLAPDDQIKATYKESQWYSNNKPTRRARLHFILTKNYGNDLLLDFIEKDINAILALFDLYQRCTHEIISNISPDQLYFILARTKVLIGQLLIDEFT